MGKKFAVAKGDLFIIIISLVIGLGILGFYNSQFRHSAEGAEAGILVIKNTATDEEQIYDLENDVQIAVEGELGTSFVEIEGGKARFSSSPCPDQICVHVFGWIDHEKQISFCLPNQVLLEVN